MYNLGTEVGQCLSNYPAKVTSSGFFIDIKEQIKYEVSFFYLPIAQPQKEGILLSKSVTKKLKSSSTLLKGPGLVGILSHKYLWYVVC